MHQNVTKLVEALNTILTPIDIEPELLDALFSNPEVERFKEGTEDNFKLKSTWFKYELADARARSQALALLDSHTLRPLLETMPNWEVELENLKFCLKAKHKFSLRDPQLDHLNIGQETAAGIRKFISKFETMIQAQALDAVSYTHLTLPTKA